MDVKVTTEEGRIEIITGCMFSGKTQELIERSKRARISGKTVIGFKPKIDDRYDDVKISSHQDEKIDAFVIDNNKNIHNQIVESINSYEENNNLTVDVVLIDEVNLFNSDILSTVKHLSSDDLRVIVSGLDQTFKAEPFDPVPDLMAIADDVEKRKAVCEKCGNLATRTQRLIDGEPASYNDPVIDVGADEKYEARCRDCHKIKYDE